MLKGISRISSEGFPFIFLTGLFGWILAFFGFYLISAVIFVLTLCLAFFFRDPEREILETKSGVLAPADGKVVYIGETVEEDFIEQERLRVSIFLSILDCHVNRFPVAGKVLGTKYTPGDFELAFKDEASENNEKLSTYIESESGLKIVMVQIAGFLARRIVSYASIGKYFDQGQRFGIIKFGSRVDIYLPLESQISVKLNDKVEAGKTVIAWLKKETDR